MSLAVIDRLTQNEALRHNNWCLPKPSCELLQLLIKSSGAKHICEIGTSIGYSTLWMASALPEDGILETIDASDERQAIAKTHLSEAGLANRVVFHVGDAIETLDRFTQDGQQFDFVFIDAAKKEYIAYYQRIKPMLCSGGLIVADNTQSHRDSMQDFIDAILSDSDVDTCDLNTPNGLIIARRK